MGLYTAPSNRASLENCIYLSPAFPRLRYGQKPARPPDGSGDFQGRSNAYKTHARESFAVVTSGHSCSMPGRASSSFGLAAHLHCPMLLGFVCAYGVVGQRMASARTYVSKQRWRYGRFGWRRPRARAAACVGWYWYGGEEPRFRQALLLSDQSLCPLPYTVAVGQQPSGSSGTGTVGMNRQTGRARYVRRTVLYPSAFVNLYSSLAQTTGSHANPAWWVGMARRMAACQDIAVALVLRQTGRPVRDMGRQGSAAPAECLAPSPKGIVRVADMSKSLPPTPKKAKGKP